MDITSVAHSRSGLRPVARGGLALSASTIFIIGTALLTGCEEHTMSDESSGQSESVQAAGAPPLSEALGERRSQYQAKADDYTKRIYKEGIDAVASSGVLDRASKTGDTAPGFTLPDVDGEPVSLASLLEDGPVVLVWYRGGWCPYCNLTLRAFEQALPDITAAGGRLVAVSPELPDNTAETVKENGLEFTVLSDVGNIVAKQYGVVFTLTPEVHAKYDAAFGFDAHNGESTGELPLAATYVIDRDGTIRYAFLDADYTKRAEPSAVVEALRSIP